LRKETVYSFRHWLFCIPSLLLLNRNYSWTGWCGCPTSNWKTLNDRAWLETNSKCDPYWLCLYCEFTQAIPVPCRWYTV